MGGDGRVRTDGGRHRTAGHRTAGHPDSWTLDGGQQPAERRTLWTTTPGDRTAVVDMLDSRIPDADSGWVDTACGHWRPTPWLACWPCRPRRPRLSSRYRLDAPPGRRRLGEQPPGPLSGTDAEGTTLPRMGLATAATVSRRWYTAVQLAPWRIAVVCWIWMVRGEGNGTTER
jgi:hypothetical protein